MSIYQDLVEMHGFRSCWNSRRWLSRISGLVFCVLFSLVAVANIGLLFDQAHPPVVHSHR